MEKFIPYEKLSKKKKRELDAGRRTVWAISPVTRKSENPKAYNRRKAQKRMDEPGSVLSFSWDQSSERHGAMVQSMKISFLRGSGTDERREKSSDSGRDDTENHRHGQHGL